MSSKIIKFATGSSAFYLSFWYAREKTVKPLDFAKRYGEDSWVLVTGGSDGLGFEFANYFAERGFNIILVSRRLNSLKNAAYSLEMSHGIKTRCIEADFCNQV